MLALALTFVLVGGFLVGMVAAVILIVCGIVLGLWGGRRSTAKRLGAASLLAGGAAVGMYAWGMAHLGMAVLAAEDGGTDSSPLIPCRGYERTAQVDDYGVSFVPLRFECHLVDGGSYATSAVPGYVNPATGILALTWVVCGILSARRRSSVLPQAPAPQR